MIQKPMLLAIALAITYLGFYGISQAQTATEKQARAQQSHWIVTCSNRAIPERLNCSMSQVVTVANGNSRQRIVSATIHRQDENAEILITLPHGLNLLKGVGFAIDEASSQRFDIHAADANGSYVRIPLTKDRVSAMKTGNIMKLSVVGSNGQNINLQLSLNGFTQAYNLMK
ncbi:MAG: invasion associated locus B family protein [Hyphomicrobiales bacterium]